MKHNYNHIGPLDPETEDNFFTKLKVPYEKSKEDIWAALEKKISEQPAGKPATLRTNRFVWAVAASFLLLAGLIAMFRYYSTSVTCPAGEHLSYELPDGSRIELNAGSKIILKPLWWKISRELYFEGEAYFEVKKGNNFSVRSSNGLTEVLGTSFNIYSRGNDYRVTCLTGTVKVTSLSSESVVIGPEYTAEVTKQGEIHVKKEINAEESMNWINNMFRFTSKPLAMVFEEIGRQYDIKVTLKAPVDFLYTGYFTKNRPAEQTLSLVCTPFGLNFVRVSEREYVISKE